MAEKKSETLVENTRDAQAACKSLAARLPKEIAVADLGVWSKDPYLALCLRAALGYRMEEVIRNGCAALERNERAVGVILARCAMENLALIRHLVMTLRRRDDFAPKDLHEVLTRMLVGGKLPGNPTDAPIAFGVMSMLDKLEKDLPGIRSLYDELSEIAHPNYGGVQGLFTKIHYDEYRTTFGRQERGEGTGAMAGIALVTSVTLFNHYYDVIGKILDEWVPTLSPLDGPRDPE